MTSMKPLLPYFLLLNSVKDTGESQIGMSTHSFPSTLQYLNKKTSKKLIITKTLKEWNVSYPAFIPLSYFFPDTHCWEELQVPFSKDLAQKKKVNLNKNCERKGDMKLKRQYHMKASFINAKEAKTKTLYSTLHFSANYLEGHRRAPVSLL